jgi:NADP-dependent 3-hydroxy acid dehydrogenase YdfG
MQKALITGASAGIGLDRARAGVRGSAAARTRHGRRDPQENAHARH